MTLPSYQFVNGGSVAAAGGAGLVTKGLHAASERGVTLCGRPVVNVITEEVDDVAWIVAGCKICDRVMKAAQ